MYSHYKGNYEKFCEFNVKVLNMPRHAFEDMNISFVKALANILQNIELKENKEFENKDLYYSVHMYLLQNREVEAHPYIENLFDFSLFTKEQTDVHYDEKEGRKFRHLVEVMKLWGLVEKVQTSDKMFINENICKEFSTIDDKTLEILRTKLVAMDIEDNSFFQSLKNIKDIIALKGQIFSYKPAINILRYIKEINRPVSQFEISNLLGIILPEYGDSEQLFNNAINIGKQLPSNLTEQQEWFFEFMDWKNEEGQLYRYKASQAPHFKFNGFILFMEDLNLIKKLKDNSIILTEYSEKLLGENIPIEVAELERYINIAEQSYSDKELAQLIVYNIKPSLLKYAAQNENFIYAMNIRSINNPKFDRKGKKVRNKLIAELAKVKAGYNCQISKEPTFRDEKGKNYVESHHIIEFNGEDGPDIVDNLLVISPFYHSLLHHACKEEIVNLYDHIRKNNIINIDLFKHMADKYHCIEEKHLKALLQKNLISNIEYKELVKYIA